MLRDSVVVPTEGSATRKRGRGRPRLSSTDDAILAATLELLNDGGTAHVSVDAVAARSGSAKTTIYRRWPTLESLIVDAMSLAVRRRIDQADEVREFDRLHGSPIHGAARQMLSLVREPMFQSSFPLMVRILLGEPELSARFRSEVFGPLRTIRYDALAELIARGDLGGRMDPGIALDMASGTILYRALMGRPVDEGIADEIADHVSRLMDPA
jgi:AcrR family transcriptional regulator